MAVLVNINCPQCGEDKQVCQGAGSITSVCHECDAKNEKEKRTQYFAELDKLTPEARLRRVEEWIYNYKPYKEPMF